MPLETAFTCPNGHNFTANAKLRARCPECGNLARRSFQQATASQSESSAKNEKTEVTTPPVHTPIKKPVLLRQGKRMPVKKPAAKVPAAKTKTAPTTKKPVAKKPAVVAKKTTSGLVTTKRVPRGTMPTIKRAPRRTAPARHVVGQGRKSGGLGGYVSDMMRKAGFGG